LTRKNRKGEKKMKKALVVLACLFVLCASIGNSLRILEVRPVLADVNDLTAQFPIELLGAATSNLTTTVLLPVLFPTDVKTAYNLPSTGGNGTIAIIDPYNDPTIQDDLFSFSQAFGLPTPNATNFEKHMMAQSISNTSDAFEISLDVEWAHAMAPNAKILLVEAINDTIGWRDGTAGPMLDAVDYARNRADVVAISMSWGINETGTYGIGSTELIFDSHFTGSNGVSFFAASGDKAQNVTWPACSPNVVGVGGTNLNLDTNGSFISETAWDLTGGGVSQYETEPSYQLSYGVQGSNGHRSVPDVSFDAGTGVYVYDSFDNSTYPWWSVGGTSLGAPCWAAIHSLKPTALNPRLYAIAKSVYNSSSLRDITAGTNGNYNATAGYDFCTGLGSPLTSAFVSSLVGDINLDGKVNILDAITLADAFRSTFGTSNWNSAADLDNDGNVYLLDAIDLANNFGGSYANGSTSSMPSQPSPAGPMTQGGPSVLVDPSQITVFKGEAFTVNVNVTGVTDLQGWEFKLYWNCTVLNCTNAVVQTPAEWQDNTLDDGSGLQAGYNATHGRFWKAEAATYPAPSLNGSMTLATLTFQAIQPGTTSLTLTDTILGDSTAQPITCSVSSGSATVYYGRYMRSDTQTINGLNAYKLNIPESNSSASNTQYGDEPRAYWGIRAWVRHSNGTEQELSLDGQTGTPKAVVTRGSLGSGMQSATVTVAQTALQPTDSLVVRVYTQVGTDSTWTLSAAFTTEQLQATTLQATTWTVYYYTYAYWNRYIERETAKFYWGTTTYNTRIQNLQYG
jgi:hypothetical protein